MKPAANESNFKQVVIFEQTKSLRNLKELSEKVETSKSKTEDPQSTKRVDTLSKNLEELAKVIKEQTKVALENGFGAKTADDIKENNVGRVKQEEKSSGLRKYLIGDTKGGMIDKMLTKREEKKALVKEKEEFVKGAISNDPRSIALKNLKGEDYAKADAEKRFAEVKAKESDVTAAKARIDASKNAGYAPKKKDLEALDKQTKELAEIDPRMQSQAKAKAKEEIANRAETGPKAKGKEELSKNVIAQGADESIQEAAKVKADSDNKVVALQSAEGANEVAMGQTLIESLDVQKQMLEAIKEGGTGSGGSILESAADLAGNLGGKGGMLSKAGKFLGKAGPGLLKAGPGLLKGGIGAIGGMALEAGGDALKENGYEKTGGAVSTLGTAASYAGTGAMLGSIVPGVGTAIGAGVGGAIGLGKGLYDNWDSMFGKKDAPTAAESGVADRMLGNSRQIEDIKAEGTKTGASPTTIINSPTNISKSTTSMEYRSPIRNPESSVNRFIQSRYGIQA